MQGEYSRARMYTSIPALAGVSPRAPSVQHRIFMWSTSPKSTTFMKQHCDITERTRDFILSHSFFKAEWLQLVIYIFWASFFYRVGIIIIRISSSLVFWESTVTHVTLLILPLSYFSMVLATYKNSAPPQDFIRKPSGIPIQISPKI